MASLKSSPSPRITASAHQSLRKSKLTFEQNFWRLRAYTGLKYVTLRYFQCRGRQRCARRSPSRRNALIPRCWTRPGAHRAARYFRLRLSHADGSCVRGLRHVIDIADSHCARWKRSSAFREKRSTWAIVEAFSTWRCENRGAYTGRKNSTSCLRDAPATRRC